VDIPQQVHDICVKDRLAMDKQLLDRNSQAAEPVSVDSCHLSAKKRCGSAMATRSRSRGSVSFVELRARGDVGQTTRGSVVQVLVVRVLLEVNHARVGQIQ
jgi:hypothetical protein